MCYHPKVDYFPITAYPEVFCPHTPQQFTNNFSFNKEMNHLLHPFIVRCFLTQVISTFHLSALSPEDFPVVENCVIVRRKALEHWKLSL